MSDSQEIIDKIDEEIIGRMQVGFDVVELTQIDLKPNGVLMVTVKNDDMDHASIQALRDQLQSVFPNNRIFVFGMGTADEVKFVAVNQEAVAKPENVGYCSNCNCGKKERAEKTLEGESNGSSESESCCGSQCGNPEGCGA